MDKKIISLGIVAILLISSILAGCQETPVEDSGLQTFKSGQQLLDALEEARDSRNSGGWFGEEMKVMSLETTASDAAAPQASGDYSETNVQVQGVDEADIIKTDGEYIYIIMNQRLIITKADPNAEILYEENLDSFEPSELFLQDDKLLLIGYSNNYHKNQGKLVPDNYIERPLTVQIYDISDKAEPELVKSLDYEGNYISSRKVDDYVYLAFSTYPRYRAEPILCEEVLPRVSEDDEIAMPITKCTDISYTEPIQAQAFITLTSINIENGDTESETILGSGGEVYSSLNNFYITQASWQGYYIYEGSEEVTTVITRFEIDDGEITYKATGSVPGTILNQFSMDEYDSNFRIATTIRGYSENRDTSVNNVYILNEDLETIGSIEDIAPGESIYSARFMGERAYLVTFKHVDPLFVLDLSDPEDPEILGKLKIPGYSDYLHPYDETHLIGIGKEVDESIDADKVHTEGAVYYTAIQGIKLAIFDVSDVENPIELHKEVIGDRGSDSLAGTDHKAFLFDKEKGLLVIPVQVAELKEGQSKGDQGEFTFQGAYVYDISLEDGFDLRGKVSHIDDEETYEKSGYYMDWRSQIQRSLYINNVLYTLSQQRLQLNDLNTLERIETLDFEVPENNYYPYYGIEEAMVR